MSLSMPAPLTTRPDSRGWSAGDETSATGDASMLASARLPWVAAVET